MCELSRPARADERRRTCHHGARVRRHGDGSSDGCYGRARSAYATRDLAAAVTFGRAATATRSAAAAGKYNRPTEKPVTSVHMHMSPHADGNTKCGRRPTVAGRRNQRALMVGAKEVHRCDINDGPPGC